MNNAAIDRLWTARDRELETMVAAACLRKDARDSVDSELA